MEPHCAGIQAEVLIGVSDKFDRVSGVKKRIAVIAEEYPPNQGGIADYVSGIVQVLLELGHEVRVVAPCVSGDELYDREWKVSITRIGECNVRRKPLGLVARFRAQLRFRRELIQWYAQNYAESPPDFAFVGSVSTWANLCIRKRIPYFVAVHGGDAFGSRADFLRSKYRRFSVNRVLNHAHVVGANSEFTKNMLMKLAINPEKVVVAYCGVTSQFYRELLKSEEVALGKTLSGNFLVLCRLVKFKAVDVVLQAFKILRETYPDITLSIAGEGPERDELEALSAQLGLTESVKFLGYIDSVSHKIRLLKESDALVMSGRYDPGDGGHETFGIVFAEAGACGRPVIGPRIGGVPEVIEDGVSGLLVEPDEVQSVVNALERILSTPGLARQMGHAGREKVAQTFDYKATTSVILESMADV